MTFDGLPSSPHLAAPSGFPASLLPLFDRSATSIPLIPHRAFAADLTKAILATSSAHHWTDELTAALHLLNDDTKLAHDIVTDREDSEACNLVHAILHRREGDYWNSNYWWSRISHPFLFSLYPSSSLSAARCEAKKFVDDVESLAGPITGGGGGGSRRKGGPSAVSACGAKNLLAGLKAKQEEELKGLVKWLWQDRDQD